MHIDKNLYWTAFVYFVGLLLLHVAWWQALIAALIMSACWFLSYGQRVVRAVGVIAMLVGLFTWFGLLPSPDHWPSLLSTIQH